MKISFFSNFLNHHQLSFCQEILKNENIEFYFIATEEIPMERKKLGYRELDRKFNFVIRSYENIESYNLAMKLALDSDVVIVGSCPRIFLKNRLAYNKLTFRYCERIFKEGYKKLLNPKVLLSLYLNHYRYRNKNLYMLCASAYTAIDFSLVNSYINKTYKWGYFPPFICHNIDELISKKRNNNKIVLLWVGRFLKWKHPEKAIKVANQLKKDGYEFILNMIGVGEELEKIKRLIIKYELGEYVFLLGSMTPEQVRFNMERADIFLFTSDYNEGWGAVLNEAMNSGCAIVASHAIGATPFLIDSGINGLIYKDFDQNDLDNKVKRLMNQRELREKIGKNAYITIEESWNANIAAKRFLDLAECIINGKEIYFEQGCCSKALPLSQGDILNNIE